MRTIILIGALAFGMFMTVPTKAVLERAFVEELGAAAGDPQFSGLFSLICSGEAAEACAAAAILAGKQEYFDGQVFKAIGLKIGENPDRLVFCIGAIKATRCFRTIGDKN